jgi:hypothetical protein
LGDRQKEGIVELADARAVTECIISIWIVFSIH